VLIFGIFSAFLSFFSFVLLKEEGLHISMYIEVQIGKLLVVKKTILKIQFIYYVYFYKIVI